LKTCDVLIVGGGVVGCAIARALSRFQLDTVLLEKEADVGFGASCRNSGVLHAGFNYAPGSLRAKLDVRGNAMMDRLCGELGVKMRRIGKLTVALNEEDIPRLRRLKEQGEANGVPGLELLDPEGMRRVQPGVEGRLALWSPSSAIVDPIGLTVGLAENALRNGVTFHLGEEVRAISPVRSGGFDVTTASGNRFSAQILVNSAGVGSDRVARMAGIGDYRIHPCRGEYYVLDKRLGKTLRTLVYPAPRPEGAGLGIHLTPTVDGNILVGPSAEYLSGGEDYACTATVMSNLREEGRALLPTLGMNDFIRNFAGIRAKQTGPDEGGAKDFVIENRETPAGFINILGIESPGLTSSPAIAEMVLSMIRQRLQPREKSNFLLRRAGHAFPPLSDLSPEDRADLVATNPGYGEIVCRCEQVSRQEIVDAAQNPLGARTLASIKYRTRAGMGRCQGGFCTPRIVRILREEFGWSLKDFCERGPSSPMFSGPLREEPER
jgi:glycerol-3-phosphate dehydrogenase